MEVHHKASPIHGWRDLLKEIGIIVLGVSIALGAEQVVEALHWCHVVAAEREALMSDAREFISAPALRRQQQPCVDRRLAEVRGVLERHGKGQPLGLVAAVSQPSRMSATRGTWQIALAGQGLAHMPLKEKLAMSNAFGDFDVWDRASAEEAEVWQRLGGLNDADLLSEQGWSEVTAAYVRARQINERMRLLAPFMLNEANLGVKVGPAGPPAGFEKMAEQICSPMIAP